MLVGLSAAAGVACGGSSSNTATAPTSTMRCAVSLRAEAPSVGAGGGTGTAMLTVNRECSWEAAADVEWITLTSPRAGQGNATLTYVVSGNPQPSVRRGSVVVNDARAEITQTGAACAFTIDSAFGTIDPEGGTLSVRVSGLSGCGWTALSQASWIRVASGASGDGAGVVTLDVAPNAGDPRAGIVVVAGQAYTVAQGASPTTAPPVSGCSYTVSPSTVSLPAAGGTAPVSIVASAGCAWTTTATADWLRFVGPPAGQGAATVTISASPNPDSAVRTASIVIAGRSVLVVQDAAPPPTPPVTCSYSAGPSTQSLPAAGGTVVVNVVAPAGCSWTATSSVGWLVVLGSSGQGSGTVSLSGAANPGSTVRSATVMVAGQTVQVTQDAAVTTSNPPACTFEVSPPGVSVGAAASSVGVAVTASAASCPWTVTSAVPWISASVPGGSGNGQVTLVVAANTATTARTGAVTIAGRTVQVTQTGVDEPAPPCTFSVAPLSQAFGADGGPGQVVVTASGTTCTWTAASGVPWITITAGAQGSGTGPVAYQVARNENTSARSGSIAVAGQTVTIAQEAAPSPACTFTVAPVTQTFGAEGGNGQVVVTASSTSCTWTAGAAVPWIAVVSGAQGIGNGAVSYQVARNEETSPRSGTLSVAGQAVTIAQDAAAPAPCTYQISPSTISVDPSGGTATTRLETPSHCTWRATSQVAWIAVTSAVSGSGSADIQITVAPNAESSSRAGTVTIGDQVLQVTQGGAAAGVVTFEGRIAGMTGACPTLSFRVMGQDVVTDGATRFEGGPCTTLRNGSLVAVEGRRQPVGSVLATRIRVIE